jgi:ribosomal protein S18 acetylase RimI-like enzyme
MTDAPTRVRRLSEDDAAAFRDIRLAGLVDEPRAFSADWASEAGCDLAWFAARVASSEVFAIEGGDGSLLGITGLSIPENPKQCHKGHIWGVYVRPEARGQGIAAALLAAAVAAARGRVESIHLGVGAYNDAARRRYRAAGFVECGFEARALRIGDAFIDEITMTMALA